MHINAYSYIYMHIHAYTYQIHSRREAIYLLQYHTYKIQADSYRYMYI